jgi:hypothetical protein
VRIVQGLVAVESGILLGTPNFSEPDPKAAIPGLLATASAARPTAAALVLAHDAHVCAAVSLYAPTSQSGE